MSLGFAGAWLAAIEVECTKGRHPDLAGLVKFSDEAFEHIAKFPPFRPESEAANHSAAISGRKSTTVARVAKRFEIPPHGKGVVRPLDPADPRSPDHPNHDEAWLELARALGRAMADRDFDRAQAERKANEDRSHLRKILK
jgi:hypothetical protein